MAEENIYKEISDENEEIVEPSGKETKSAKEEVETDETSHEEAVLSKEDVEGMGLGKGFIGKPLSVLKDVLASQNAKFTQMSQSLSELRKEFAESKELSNKELKQVKEKAEENAEDELGEMPDPVNDFDDYKAWMKKKDDLTTKNFEKILAKVLDEKLSGISKSTAELQADKNSQIYVERLTAELRAIYGETYKPELLNQVSEEYESALKELDEDEQNLINQRLIGKPESIVREVIKNHKALLYGRKTETDEEKTERIKAEQKKKVDQLKNTNKQFTKQTSSPREKAKPDDSDNIYKNIADENEIMVKQDD